MLRKLFSVLLRVSTIPFFTREIVQRGRVTILVYHRLAPDVAERHFRVLRRLYSPISLNTYLRARIHDRMRELPPKALVVTIDDGHESVARLKPVLAKYQLPVTVFLCSDLVGTNRPFWFSAPGLGETERQRLKTVSDEQRLSAVRDLVCEDAAASFQRDSLNVDEMRELHDVADFQSHSASHPILPTCPDAKARAEIWQSKARLEELGVRVNAFAYPNGSYTPREMEMVRAAGYQCGLTMDPGFNAGSTPLFALKRLVIRDDCDVHELVIRACGLWQLLRNVRLVLNRSISPLWNRPLTVPESRTS